MFPRKPWLAAVLVAAGLHAAAEAQTISERMTFASARRVSGLQTDRS